ncbi:MAG: ABC transporter substrate-binding protein, partial [Gemmatimonadetes bacterium]|nr:ABC transporter substrate-binding protein [Gemmatimonadota bacterium]
MPSSTSRLVPAILAAALCAGCGSGPERAAAAAAADSAVVVRDDAGAELRLPRTARRIVSLVPSATESLLAMGAGGRVVGRSDLERSPRVASIPSVGGGVNPSLEAVVALRPDLVIAWGADESPTVRPRLEALGIPVLVLQGRDTSHVFRSIARLGAITGMRRSADSLSAAIRAGLDSVRAEVAGLPRRTVFYVVWHDPPVTVGPRS